MCPLLSRAAASALPLLLALTACSEHAPLAPASLPAPSADVRTELRCLAEVRTLTLSCEDAGVSGTGARRNVLIVGGQHHKVRLITTSVAFTAADSILSATVSIQNLLLAPVGGTDPAAPATDGLRVFFHTGPPAPVVVENPSGVGAFTAADQPYFLYQDADLGGDGLLSPDEVSAGKEWRFNLHGVESFSFTLYVQEQIPAGAAYDAHFTQVAPGGPNTCAIADTGAAYCWGDDEWGELGNGTSLTDPQGVPSPVEMPAGVTFTEIAASHEHTCALGSNRRAYCWGYYGAIDAQPPPPDWATVPGDAGGLAGVTLSRLSAGGWHNCMLGSDGKGYCWGRDDFGQLGVGPAVPGTSLVSTQAGLTITDITAGQLHTCALASNAKAYCWGINSIGQTGMQEVGLPPGVTLSRIVAGGFHTCGITAAGAVWCWGSDANGQLGNGSPDSVSQLVPMPVATPPGVTFASITSGGQHTCALATNGTAWCWGWDLYGQLGSGPGTASQHQPTAVQMPTGVVFTSLAAKGDNTCATSANAVWCWGLNNRRQVGDGTAIQRDVPTVVAGSR
jgi:alpha-tubulin suppressor-like RCC1 family protein